mmetsp:Transcript_56414/g.132129  ORF Transcript_56414/g.132129 Transcript_56414/m.132129 type:complete len:351 (+) Transcript_56414:95-1147(+)
MAPRGEGVGGLTSHMRSMGLDGSAPPPLTPTPPPSIWREKKKSGAAAPSSAAAGAQPGSSGPPQGAQWEWKAFTNTARTDGLELRHWQKKGVPVEEYQFSRFNKKLQLIKYTDEEYTKYLACTEWTKQDTDLLMKLVARFDLNFILVHDRWTGDRIIEQLKDRFYLCQRKVAEARGLVADGEECVLMQQPYNKEWEAQRKSHMERLYARSKQEEAAEAAVTEEARKLEALQRKRKADTKKKQHALGGGNEEEEPPACPPGGVVLRSGMMARSAEKLSANKWLAQAGIAQLLSTQRTQAVFAALCADVITLMDWHKRVSRKKKEREQMSDRRQELLRPLKKRKTAPSQRLQ